MVAILLSPVILDVAGPGLIDLHWLGGHHVTDLGYTHSLRPDTRINNYSLSMTCK